MPGTGYYYTVQPTDTLWDIAVAHGISVEALGAANAQVDPKRLQAGQMIFVPAQPAVVPRKPTPAPAPPPTPRPEVIAAPAQEAGQTPAPVDAPPPEPAPFHAPLPETAPVDTVAAPTPEPAPIVEEVARRLEGKHPYRLRHRELPPT